MRRDKSLFSLLIMVLPVVVLWGLNFAVIRTGVTSIGAFTLGAMRFAIASLPFILFIRPPKVPVLFLASYAAFFGLVQFGLLFIGMRIGLPSGLASLLLQLQAVFTPVLALLTLREPIGRFTLGAIALSLAGLALILVADGQGESSLLPLLLGVGAAASWATSNVLIRFGARQGSEYDSLALVVWASLLLPVPFLILAGIGGELSALTPASLMAALWPAIYLGLMATIIGYVLWVRALATFDAATVAPFSLLIPVIGLSAGYLIFGEALSLQEAGGCALIIGGVVVHLIGTTLRRPKPGRA